MNKPALPPKETPQEIAAQTAQTFFGAGTDEASQRRAIRQYLAGAMQSCVLIPSLFYLRFGEVGELGWGMTIFFVAYCLLAAIGLYFQPRTEYHTTVAIRGDWADRVGAFWLVSCAFGPLLGWVITSSTPISTTSWRWVYELAIFCAAGLPIITALPLTRYVRGKASWVALPLLVVVTLLPVMSVVNESQDLRSGPIVRQVKRDARTALLPELYLKHTQRSLGIAP